MSLMIMIKNSTVNIPMNYRRLFTRNRHISIDVHHSILPVTSRLNPDMKKMMDDAVDLGNGFHTFSDVDIVLHSVVHLFHDGEIRSSIRNLLEQHDMYSEFGMNDGFGRNLFSVQKNLA